MSNSNVNFVKKSQVLMCHYEDCWDSKNNAVIQDHNIKANIKPEIGKIRPVVIVYPHKRARLAIVIPFTTKKPFKKNTNVLYIPCGIMPGVLGRAECWALCDMPHTINICRLKTVFSGTKNNYFRHINQSGSTLPTDYFNRIIEKTTALITK
jgi:uncharacterized protein YifN (PemK superfamily)